MIVKGQNETGTKTRGGEGDINKIWGAGEQVNKCTILTYGSVDPSSAVGTHEATCFILWSLKRFQNWLY